MNAQLPVRAFVDPIRGIAGPPVEFARPERATLADIIALAPLDNEALRPHLRVKLGGVLIDPSLYHRVLPKQDAFLTVVLPVEGDDGGLLGTIAAVALLGASLFVGGFGVPFLGAAFAAGTTGASLVAGGLSIAASLLLQGLNAPQPAREDNSADDVGVASAQNSFEPGAYLPRVMGTRRIAPPMVMPPYTETNGDIQHVYAVYGLAGPHKIEDIKIGATAIAGANDVEYEVREGFAGGANLTLVTKTVIEDSIALQMSEFISSATKDAALDTTMSPNTPQWHRLQTRNAPDLVRLGFLFDRGMHWVDSADTGAYTALRLRIRRKGTATWFNLPEFVIRGQRSTAALRLEVEFQWLASGSMPASVTAFSPNYRGFSYKYHSVTEVDGAPTTYWTADSYFATNKIDWVNPQKLKVYLNTTNFAQDTYEIEAIRGQMLREGDFNASTHVIIGSTYPDDFFTPRSDPRTFRNQEDFMRSLRISYLQSIWNEYPFDLSNQPTALLCIKARNRSIERVSCLASGYTENWNGSTWVANQLTKNPASWYREALTSDLNAEPTPDSLVDTANLQDWHQWCAANGYELNAVVQGQPVTEVLSLIAQAGFARPRFGATHGVVIDRSRSPVGLVTQRNASGFGFQKPFGRLPHALRVNLADETNDYDVRELVVYADGYAGAAGGGLLEATRFESVTYPGITSQAQAKARAQRDMRFAKHRSRLINFTMDIEHLEFQLGDLVLLETDILGQIGGRGRVVSISTSGGLVTGLKLDEERDFTHADANGLQRAVALRLADGTVRIERVTSNDSDPYAVVFTTPFAMPTSGGDDLIAEGTLVASGTLGMEARRILIWDMAPGPDLTCQIVGIDYAEEAIYRRFVRSVLFQGRGSLAVAPRRVRKAAVAFAGVGTLSATYTSAADVAVAFAGTGHLEVAPKLQGVRRASLSGTGTLVVAPRLVRAASVAFAGVGNLSAGGYLAKNRAAAFAGTGALAVSPVALHVASVALGGVGTLAIERRAVLNRLVAFAGVGSLAVLRRRIVNRAVAMAGVGSLALAPVKVSKASRTYVNSVTSGGTSTTKTMTHNAGARTGKWVVVLSTRQGVTGPADPTGVTFRGVALTKLAGASGSGQMNCSIWISTADITTDGTDSVVATYASSQSRTVSSLYAVDNLNSTIAVATATPSNASPANLTLNVSAGGIVIGGMCSSTSTTTSWTGLTEDLDQTDGTRTESAASGEFAAAASPATISATQSSSNAAAVAVSLR